jgi:hypothetical protein
MRVGNSNSRRFQRKKTDILNPNTEKDIRLAVLQPLQVQSGSGRIFFNVLALSLYTARSTGYKGAGCGQAASVAPPVFGVRLVANSVCELSQ